MRVLPLPAAHARLAQVLRGLQPALVASVAVFDDFANHRLSRGDRLRRARHLNRALVPAHVQLGAGAVLNVLDHVPAFPDDASLAAHTRHLDRGLGAAAAAVAAPHHRLLHAVTLLLLHAVSHLLRLPVSHLLRLPVSHLLRLPVSRRGFRRAAVEARSLGSKATGVALRARPVASLPLPRRARAERIDRKRHGLQHDPTREDDPAARSGHVAPASALDNLRAGSALSLNLLDGRAAAAYDAALLAGARHLDGHVFLHVVAPEHLGKVRGRRVLARVDLRLRGREQFGDHRPGRLHLRAAKAPAGYRTRARAIALVDVAALDHLRDERRGVPHDRLGARHDARPAFSAHLNLHREFALDVFHRLAPLADDAALVALDVDLDGRLAGVGIDRDRGHVERRGGRGGGEVRGGRRGGSVHLESLRASVARFFVRVPFRVGGLLLLAFRVAAVASALALLLLDGVRDGLRERRFGLGRRRGLLVVVVVVVVVVVAVRGICIYRRGGIGVVVCGGVGIGGGGSVRAGFTGHPVRVAARVFPGRDAEGRARRRRSSIGEQLGRRRAGGGSSIFEIGASPGLDSPAPPSRIGVLARAGGVANAPRDPTMRHSVGFRAMNGLREGSGTHRSSRRRRRPLIRVPPAGAPAARPSGPSRPARAPSAPP